MKLRFRNLPAWFLAVLTTAALGSLFSTLRVSAQLISAGAPGDIMPFLSMALYDVGHFGIFYGSFIAIAFLIAFFAGGVLYKKLQFGRFIIFACAGGIAVGVMLGLMQQVFFGQPIVGGARDNLGLILQLLAGMAGGLVYAQMTKKHFKSNT